jgi:hypothetical protein
MSSASYLGKQTNWLDDYIAEAIDQGLNELWGPIPGEVVSYDAATQTATVKPLYKPLHNGEPFDMPELYEVPVEQPRTGNMAFTMPIPAGTKVMLNPSMRSREKYDDENDGAPSDGRAFHLADMRATIVGGDSLTDPLQNVDAENAHWRWNVDGSFGMRASEDGKVKIEGAQGNIYQLYNDAVEECQKVADALKDEPALVHTPVYAAAAAALETILGKLRAMEL